MDRHRCEILWFDRDSAQQGEADAHPICLADLAWDRAYADEAGEQVASSRRELWLLRAFDLAEDATTLSSCLRHCALRPHKRCGKATDSLSLISTKERNDYSGLTKTESDYDVRLSSRS